MFKKFLAALAAFVALGAFAAVDANKGSQAELEAVKGIGPVISTHIINERKKGDFKDWNDMVVRVKGVGEKNAAKFSEGGLTVNGASYAGAPAKSRPRCPLGRQSGDQGRHGKDRFGHQGDGAKAASAVKGGAAVVKEDAKEQKDAVKENVKDAKEKRAEKKAEKAEKKAEKAAAASAASTARSRNDALFDPGPGHAACCGPGLVSSPHRSRAPQPKNAWTSSRRASVSRTPSAISSRV